MRKIAYILLCVLVSGCSVLKKEKVTDSDLINKRDQGTLLKMLKAQNLTNTNFFIKSADISITYENKIDRLLGTIRFIKPDQFLISMRSKTGIEVARIFITKDTLLINDRINRKMYFGKSGILRTKYGIAVSCLPILFGDYVSEKQQGVDNIECLNGSYIMDNYFDGYDVEYEIDCRKAKLKSVKIDSGPINNSLDIRFDDFVRNGDIFTAGKIFISFMNPDIDISIRIRKMDYPWDGNIEFVPGSRYELIELK